MLTGRSRSLVVAAVVLATLVVSMLLRRGVFLELHNAGGETLRDVVVTVSRVDTPLGDLAPGASLRERLRTDSVAKLVELRWRVGDRESYARVECYFEESGYNGVVRFVLDGLVAKETEADTEPGFF